MCRLIWVTGPACSERVSATGARLAVPHITFLAHGEWVYRETLQCPQYQATGFPCAIGLRTYFQMTADMAKPGYRFVDDRVVVRGPGGRIVDEYVDRRCARCRGVNPASMLTRSARVGGGMGIAPGDEDDESSGSGSDSGSSSGVSGSGSGSGSG